MTNLEIIEIYQNSLGLLTQKSIRKRSELLRDLLQTFQKSFLEITDADLRNYIIKKKEDGKWKTAGTIAQKIVLLRMFFKFLVNERMLLEKDNPAKNLKSPRQTQNGAFRTLTMQEIKKLFHAAESPMIELKQKLLFFIAMNTGLRANEICLIQKQHINLEKRLIFIPKENVKGQYRDKLVAIQDNRTVELLSAYISKYPSNSDYVFQTRFGKRMGPRVVYQAMRDIIDVAYPHVGEWNKPYGPHLARHTFASRWIESGGPREALIAIMGWTGDSQFKRYVNVSPNYIAEAASKVANKMYKGCK